MNTIVNIVSREDYDKTVEMLERMAAKGEKNLTKKELTWLENTARSVADYEEKNELTPIVATSVSEKETDVDKIRVALGYEPELVDIIRFKMLQRKMNQKTLAAILGMAQAKVSQILSGKREPDVAFLQGIHSKLGIDGNVLLEIV
jgi:HTH-type transcriptional regulator/antitoxin HigA